MIDAQQEYDKENAKLSRYLNIIGYVYITIIVLFVLAVIFCVI